VKRALLGLVLICIFSTFSLAFSQNATTSLRGIVKDPSGALVPKAKITITDSSTGRSYTAVANNAGEYVFTQILPARYTITAIAMGFGVQSKTAELLVDQPATVDFALTVQATAETVDVTASAQTLNTSDASLGNSASNELIQALPSETRNVPDLLSLQPGVLYLPPPTDLHQGMDSRSGAVNGGRSDQGNVTVDGIDDNDQVNGYAFNGVLRQTQDSIEEFRVTTGNAGADSGRSSGAQISMVTKSGTNKFHGATYWYNRPTMTVANNWFNKQAELNEGLPNIAGKLIRNILGASFGGPIKKDKLFFFGNYEASRMAENAEVTQTTPTSSYIAGNLLYQDGNGNTQTLSSTDVAGLDAGCTVCNTTAYPNPPGPDPNALTYFKSMPVANGTSEGDGLNEGSYAFSSPNPIHLNTSIGRIDYNPSAAHRIFARGNLQDDTYAGTEQFPGQGPATETEDNSKGFTVGHTWTISSNLVNDVRYGYIRQAFSNRGVGVGDYVDFRFLSTETAETRTTITSVPANNIVDNLTWSKGKHTLQFGGNWRLIHQNFNTDAFSYNSGSSNPYWLGGSAPGPSDLGGGFTNSYLIAYANLVGTIPSVTNNYNYAVTSATGATLLADGVPLSKHFSANEYEWYVQDSWRAQPNLTITFGIRHSLLQTPWETKGQELTPTVNTHDWYLARESSALQGIINEPDLSFATAGHFYNKPGYYPKSKDNIAPRLSLAYSPDTKTSIRAGVGIFYDHFGESLISNFAQNGQFGLSSAITNPASIYSTETAPRFTSRTTFPFNNGVGAPTETFPYAPADFNALISTGLDSRMKTPYSESFDLDVQRQLPGGFMIDAAYYGRLGRHLLQSLDLAEPTDFVDPQGGGDYYAAGRKLYQDSDATGNNPLATVQTIQYWEDMFPWMQNYDYQGESATQAIYSDEFAPSRLNLGATTALIDIDLNCGSAYQNPYPGHSGNSYPCPSNFQSRFWQNQFASLFSLSTMGMSYYNSGQFSLRHPMSHGLQLDVSYTYSQSLDMGSDAERNPALSSNVFSIIQNTWKPGLNRGPSDFDTRHLLTVDYVYLLPFGKGRQFAASTNTLVDTFIGGWQLSGILRNSSGLPFSFTEPGYTTNWTYGAYGTITGSVKPHKQYVDGDVQYFSNASAINNGVVNGNPVRLPYPGEAGERNNLRGDGYFNLDSGLSKSWKLREYGGLKFAWEVYNVTNSVRFDPASIGGGLTGGNLGVASTLLSVPRRMQFSLRYDF
jgi:hypothetical protein